MWDKDEYKQVDSKGRSWGLADDKIAIKYAKCFLLTLLHILQAGSKHVVDCPEAKGHVLNGTDPQEQVTVNQRNIIAVIPEIMIIIVKLDYQEEKNIFLLPFQMFAWGSVSKD